MEKLSMCRICLVMNVRMYVVVNKNLHELYERLTDVPFVTDDSRPILACFICCAKLKQCFRLLRKCLEAEELFAQIMNGNYEQKPLINQDHLEFAHGFIISPILSLSIVEAGQTDSVVVKEELLDVCERQDDILEPKEEYQSDDLERGNLDDSRLDVEDILPQHLESDSKDDVPLIEIKIEEEEEQETFREKRRAVETNRSTVAEKLKLHLRRTKLEDSIPAHQNTNQIPDSEISRNTQNRTSKYISEIKKLHECEICHREFSTKSNFNKHVRTHTGEKPHNCHICQRSFSQKDNLKKHILIHTGEKPYKCVMCQRSFSRKNTLTNHIRTHTGEKPYKCDICESSFNQKSLLMYHNIRSHTGEKPYKCDICQRCFRQKGALTGHIRTHTGEKPYNCDKCPCKFRLKNSLTRHERTHTGEKPFKCDVCQVSFGRKSTLIEHIRTHTGGKHKYK